MATGPGRFVSGPWSIVGLLALLVASGVGLVVVHAGPLFAALNLVHRVSTIAFTVVIVGHIVVAVGILPGYRGVWRSMHLGGRLTLDTARRLWPGWTERRFRDAGGDVSGEIRPDRAAPSRGRARTRSAP